jgi:hypothetical protein
MDIITATTRIPQAWLNLYLLNRAYENVLESGGITSYTFNLGTR